MIGVTAVAAAAAICASSPLAQSSLTDSELDSRIEQLRADLHAALDERARRNKAAAEARREQRRLADAAFLGSDYG